MEKLPPESPNGKLPSLVARIGIWTNSNMEVIARIPGMFYLFRVIYRFLYPISRADVVFAKGLTGSASQVIDKLLIVSPQSWARTRARWAPAEGNIFFEIWQSAVERYGQSAVGLHQIEENDQEWLDKVLSDVVKHNPTHILIQGEESPNGDPYAYINLAKGLARIWHGQLIFVMYDSVYWWHVFLAENVVKLFPNTAVHAIDRYPYEVRGIRKLSGPGILPISQETLSALRASPEWSDSEKFARDVTFVGTLYPDRLRQLAALASAGVSVDVNPHRVGKTTRPGYAEYVAAIRHSWATINLSRNHGMPKKHVKTRVLEAPLFGTVLFSDEKESSKIMIPEDGFVYFRNGKDLHRKIVYFKTHPCEYEVLKMRGMEYAERIASSVFWEAIERGQAK